MRLFYSCVSMCVGNILSNNTTDYDNLGFRQPPPPPTPPPIYYSKRLRAERCKWSKREGGKGGKKERPRGGQFCRIRGKKKGGEGGK